VQKEAGAASQKVINMLPARPISLDDLPAEILDEVVRRLPCRADRACLRCCNRYWKDSIKNYSEPLQLPWLLLPSTVELLYYSVTGDRFRNFRPIPMEIQDAQFAGASDGEWLFLVSKNPPKHQIFNLFSGWSISLPIAMMMESRQVDVTVISAVLSGDPNYGDYTVAAIVSVVEGGNTRAAFWKNNMILWADCGNVALQRAGVLAGGYLPLDMELEDVVHICGTFWYLTSEEELVRLVPVEDLNGQLRMVARGLNVQIRADFEPGVELDDDEVFKKGTGELTKRYLVESSGHPLMVVRNIEGQWTVGLRVFRVQFDGDNARWDELFEIPGETLFIGHGCSRSYKVGEDQFKIYFFHDRITRTRVGERDLYWRTDSGIATSIGVRKWPVLLWHGRPVPAASDQAPPTWMLH
jgi:hypothetical protein